jgi:hypothetical protein
VRLRDTAWGPAVTLVAVLPAVILPAVGWGVGGKLEPVRYPHDIAAAVRIVDSDPRPGVVAVLPFTTYRAYPWNGDRAVLDVLPRWFTRPAVYASDLPVTLHGRLVDVAGDDPFAARVAAQLAHGRPSSLGALGVRWIVVDAVRPAVDIRGLTLRLRGTDVAVYEVPSVVDAQALRPAVDLRPPGVPVVIGAILGLGSAVAMLAVVGCRSAYCLVASARTRRGPTSSPGP